MQKRTGLRVKAYLLIIPLVVVVVGLSGVTASMASRAALTRVATRLLAYKAEQLRDFAHSEWEMLESLGLSGFVEYRESAELSFRTYATSLLRSSTENIIAVDSTGTIVMSVGLNGGVSEGDRFDLDPGWFEHQGHDSRRVGVAFTLEPFGWTVAVTESREMFFADIRDIRDTHILILSIAVFVAIGLISLFVSYMTRPVERLTNTLRHISDSHDLSRRVVVESTDEVGILANEFNTMIDSLQKNYEKLNRSVQNEIDARRTTAQREEETLLLLGRAAEFRDQETGDHLMRVGALCALVSRLLGRDIEYQQKLRRASPLHDIGKIGIPDRILLKPGKLTDEEFREMKTHTTIGFDLLKDSESEYLIVGAEIALTHHEKWDGTGYPQGLRGGDIPLTGRIVGLVDVFDALTSDRVYKQAWTPERARDLIVEGREQHFDPDLVDLFESNFVLFKAEVIR